MQGHQEKQEGVAVWPQQAKGGRLTFGRLWFLVPALGDLQQLLPVDILRHPRLLTINTLFLLQLAKLYHRGQKLW